MNKILASACLASLCLTAQANQGSQQWTFSIAPYIWAINLNGNAGVAGITVPVSENFLDLWTNLDFAAMLFFDAHYDRLGIFLNSVYTKVSNSATVAGEKADLTNVYGIFTPGLSYQVVRQEISDSTQFILEPYVGGRITKNDTSISYSDVDYSNNQWWTDPIIGSRFIFKFYQQWTLALSADIGGTTSPNQRSYNAIALVGYEFPNVVVPVSLFGGFRYLHQTFITGSGADSFEWDMGIYGPMLGVEIEF